MKFVFANAGAFSRTWGGRLNVTLVIFAGLSLFFGVWLRSQGLLDRALEYDEIWTLTHYSNENIATALTALGTPNNHPLNSILSGLVLSMSDSPTTGIRLPVFVFGVLSLLAVGLAAFALKRSLMASSLAIFFLTVNAASVHYSQTGRGYAIQSFFVTLFLFAVVFSERRSLGGAGRARLAVLAFFSAVFAELSLPTSALFLLPIAVAHAAWMAAEEGRSGDLLTARGVFRVVWKNRAFLTAYLLFFVITSGWLLCHLNDLQAARSFGTRIVSPVAFFLFAKDVFLSLFPSSLAALLVFVAVPFRRRDWRMTVFFVWILLFPLLAAFFTKAGPARVYLALTPVLCVGAALGLKRIFDLEGVFLAGRARTYARILTVGFVMFLALGAYPGQIRAWTPIDWRKYFEKAKNVFPSDYFLVYPTGDGYSVFYNNYPEVIYDNLERISNIKDSSYFLQLESKGEINGMELNTRGEKGLPAPVKGVIVRKDGVGGCLYMLRRIKEGDDVKDAMALASAVHVDVESAGRYYLKIISLGSDCLSLNNFFDKVVYFKGRQVRSHVFVFRNKGLSAEDFVALEKSFGGGVKFYLFAPVPYEEANRLQENGTTCRTVTDKKLPLRDTTTSER